LIAQTLEESTAKAHESGGRAGRARRTLAQLQGDGFGIDVLETDAAGPLVIRRRSMEETIWRRAGSARGKEAVFELEAAP
jgi:hypothetical protein